MNYDRVWEKLRLIYVFLTFSSKCLCQVFLCAKSDSSAKIIKNIITRQRKTTTTKTKQKKHKDNEKKRVKMLKKKRQQFTILLCIQDQYCQRWHCSTRGNYS